MAGTRESYSWRTCKRLWKCDVPTKAIALAWRILINRLPTRELNEFDSIQFVTVNETRSSSKERWQMLILLSDTQNTYHGAGLSQEKEENPNGVFPIGLGA